MAGGNGADTMGNAIATDSANNIYIAGSTSGDLDGNTLTSVVNYFITKYDSAGVKQWTYQSALLSVAYGITVDSAGSVYVTGTTQQKMFVEKHDPSTGAMLWTQQLTAALTVVEGYGITSDPSNNVYITGYTSGALPGNSLTGSNDAYIAKYNSSGTRLWIQQLGATYSGSGVDTYGYGITSDASANIYITGYTYGDLDGNTLTQQYDSDAFVTKYDTSGARQWTKTLGASNGEANGRGITCDSSNVYISGSTSAGLDGNTLIGDPDFFVTKFNNAGTKQWTRELGPVDSTPANVEVTDIAKDASSNMYVTGYTTGSIDSSSTLNGDEDAIVAKFDNFGHLVWAKQMGVAATSTEGNAITTDSSGNIFITGRTGGNLNAQTLTGSYDAFITKFLADGTQQWTTLYSHGGSGVTTSDAIVTDSSGNIYVAGYGDKGNFTEAYGFIVKFNPQGVRDMSWTKDLGDAGNDTRVLSIAVDSLNNIYATGQFTGGTVEGMAVNDDVDSFIVKYDSDGAKQWGHTMFGSDTSSVTEAQRVKVDSGNNVYVGGHFTGPGTFDGHALTGTTDLLLIKFNSAGTQLWSTLLGASGAYTYGYGLAIDTSDNPYIGGYSFGNLDGIQLTGTADFYIIKYDPQGTKVWSQMKGLTGAFIRGIGLVSDSADSVYMTGYTDNGSTFPGNESVIGDEKGFIAKFNSAGDLQ